MAKAKENVMSAKSVVIVLGSPRKNRNSTALAQRVAEGAKEAGAEAKNVYLNGINTKPCTACDVCRRSVGIDCNITYDMYDMYDMKSMYSRLRRADAMVFTTKSSTSQDVTRYSTIWTTG